MAISGVNGNPIELLISQDKSIQDFLGTIKAGDTLKGKVLDILPGENKAIINFRGFNIISELPVGMLINKGDIINVQVSKLNDQIFMKLVPPSLSLGTGAEMPGTQEVSAQQLINMLNTVKVPVNEQNIFIAQKLADYHLPVTAENISEINVSLANYMQNKGIDVRAFNVQTPQAAKEIVAENMLNLKAQLDQIVAVKSETPASSGNAGGNGGVNTGAGINGNTGGNIIVPKALINSPAGMREKINNIINTIAAVAAGSEDIQLNEDSGVVTLSIKNPQPDLVKNLALSALRDGAVTAAEADTLINDQNLAQPAVINAGSVVLNKAAGNSIDIKFINLREMIETAAASDKTGGQSALTQAAENMRESFNNKLLGLNPPSQNLPAVLAKPDIMAVISPDLKPALQTLRDNTALLMKSVTSPGDINMEQNIKDIATQIANINSAASALSDGLKTVPGKAAATPAQTAVFKSEVNAIFKSAQDISAKLSLPAEPEELLVAPRDFTAFQSTVKQFALGLDSMDILKIPAQVNDGKPVTVPVQVNPAIDMESTIESITFLKSRNLDTGNSGFIDIMGRYFKNDMKLNQNMEALNMSFDSLDALKNTATGDRLTNAFINNINNMTSNIRQLMQGISINPAEQNLKLQAMQGQLSDFIDKSGMNSESKLKDMALLAPLADTAAEQPAAVRAAASSIQAVSAQTAQSAMNATRETLKSQLISLNNAIESASNLKLNTQQKNALNNVREKSADILTNMNALQFINQKPVSYEALYTQIPVFLNNKFFNGEIQVWFRKGSLKENYEKSMPINFVFMLNTSNMGNVKISMTVYKKDVECNVTIDNEKAKQVLMRGKNEFLKSMEGVNFNMKNFNIQMETDSPVDAPKPSDGYVNLGRINMQA